MFVIFLPNCSVLRLGPDLSAAACLLTVIGIGGEKVTRNKTSFYLPSSMVFVRRLI